MYDFRELIETFNLNPSEFEIFLSNYYDSMIYNPYLYHNKDYTRLNFNTSEKIIELLLYFEESDIEIPLAKKIVISSPQVFYCTDFREQLDFVYKDSTFEGIIIEDEEGYKHPYRIKDNLRSITENSIMLEHLVLDSESDYKKVYYTRAKNNLYK